MCVCSKSTSANFAWTYGATLLCFLVPLLFQELKTCAAAVIAGDSQAMLGVSWGGFSYNIDPLSGQYQELSRPDHNFNSMARSESGEYLASASQGQRVSLYLIDPLFGSANLLTNVQGLGDGQTIRGMTFSTDGRLFIATNPASRSGTTFQIYEIDSSSGDATLIGATGLSGLQSLATASDGMIYGFDIGTSGQGLVTIDPSTGLAADVNPLIDDQESAIQSLAFSPDGTLFGMGQEAIFTVNTLDGTLTLVAPFSIDIRGMEFFPIPEPHSFRLFLTGLLVFAIMRYRSHICLI